LPYIVAGIITALTVDVAFIDCCEPFLVYPQSLLPEASTPQVSLVVKLLRRNEELRFHPIQFSTQIKTIIAIQQSAVTANKIGLM
jgi:hypothetical protein